MKLTQILDRQATALISDIKNQLIMKELVLSEYSVTELANKLNIPTVTLWKRMQRLLSERMVEVSKTRKSGNLESKLYRATAARYIPAELLDIKPKDKHLSEAFGVYSEIQKAGMAFLSRVNQIPEGVNPVDYGIYVNMRAFVQVFEGPDLRQKISRIQEELSKYEPIPD